MFAELHLKVIQPDKNPIKNRENNNDTIIRIPAAGLVIHNNIHQFDLLRTEGLTGLVVGDTYVAIEDADGI